MLLNTQIFSKTSIQMKIIFAIFAYNNEKILQPQQKGYDTNRIKQSNAANKFNAPRKVDRINLGRETQNFNKNTYTFLA